MEPKLLGFLKEIQSDERFDAFDEPSIKQGIVLKIISFLDWDPFDMDEVQPEYETKGGKIDFSLRHKNSNKVFIAVKKGAKALKKHQEQLSAQAVQEGVKLAVLTDGITWWFSLPMLKGTVDEKRFHTIDINEQRAEDIAEKFYEFLSKKNIVSGKAAKAAEEIYHNRLKALLIRETLPEAWKKILSEPGQWLYEVLAEATKELCGHKPDQVTVKKFIALETDAKAEISSILKPTQTIKPEGKKPEVKKEDYTGKSLVSFTFRGTKYEVKTWRGMLLKICEIIASKHKEDFEMVLTLAGPNKEYFSTNPYELLTCEKIAGTEIHVDVNLSAMGVVALSHRILSLFGYTEKDLSIQTK